LPDSAGIVARKQFKHEVKQMDCTNGLEVLLKPLKQDGRMCININSPGGYDQLPAQQVLAGKLLEQVIPAIRSCPIFIPQFVAKNKSIGLESPIHVASK